MEVPRASKSIRRTSTTGLGTEKRLGFAVKWDQKKSISSANPLSAVGKEGVSVFPTQGFSDEEAQERQKAGPQTDQISRFGGPPMK